MAEPIRLPSSVGIGHCMDCGAPCLVGWSHFDPEEGLCELCSFLIAGPEFVRDVLGSVAANWHDRIQVENLAADLFAARGVPALSERGDTEKA